MSQNEKLAKHLVKKGSITQLEAIGVLRVFNLKGRIHELRTTHKHLLPEGKTVVTVMKQDSTGKSYADYVLVDEVAWSKCFSTGTTGR